MPTPIKMPALSPTMEEGTLAKWLVKVGDTVSSGDIMAEIETDKATMEFEAVDEGTIASIDVAEGSEGVKVGAVIATLAMEGEDAAPAKPAPAGNEAVAPAKEESREPAAPAQAQAEAPKAAPAPSTATGSKAAPQPSGDRIVASPLAKRIAEQKGVDLSSLKGSGPNGRIVKADVEGAQPGTAAPAPAAATPTQAGSAPSAAAPVAPTSLPDFGIPHEDEKLSGVRKVIARRLTESKQTVPHYYLAIDVRLDAMLKLRGELNAALEAQGIKLSVNDLLIKALAKALLQVPDCNVSFGGDTLRRFSRADISVAVAAPSGLITPIIVDAGAEVGQRHRHRDENARRQGARGQAAARRIPGRHRQPVQPRHVRDQAVRSGDQPAARHDHGRRRGREAPLRGRRRARHCIGDDRHRQLRPPRHRRRYGRGADAGLQGAGGGTAGAGGLSGYSPLTLSRAKRLRRDMTDVERRLWGELRADGLGAKWRRQQPIGRYIVDFVCQSARLVVELDGGQHSVSDADARRTAWLESAGYRVLRFWNHEVLENIDGVLIRIAEALASAPSPTPTSEQARKSAYPLPQGERLSALNSSPLEGEEGARRVAVGRRGGL